MQECGEEVGIVYLNWKLDEDVLIPEIGLLQAVVARIRFCSKE